MVYLVDSENVFNGWVNLLNKDVISPTDKLYVFYTQNTHKISYVEMLIIQDYAQQVQFVPCECGEKNALDFQLSYYLGFLSKGAKKSDEFCILSNDKGFDYVVDFAKKSGLKASRKNCNDVLSTKFGGNMTMPL